MDPQFVNRQDAGRLLAHDVLESTGRNDVLVLGLPRGGVPVAFEIARQLGAPLDVFVVRKLELPDHRGVLMGEIAAGGVRVLDFGLIAVHKIPSFAIEEVAKKEAMELSRLERYYRGRRPAPKMMGRTIVVVDDGLSPASMLRAAIDALRVYQPRRIVLAAPLMDPDVYEEIKKIAGAVITAMPPEPVGPTGSYYQEGAVSDRDVRQLLSRAAHAEGAGLKAAS